jgi:hypothetical protein
MQSGLVLVCFAALVATSCGLLTPNSAKLTHWRSIFSRSLTTDACVTALQNVANCVGDWSGDGATTPTACCSLTDPVYMSCGNSSVNDAFTAVLDKADTFVRESATLQLFSLLSNCPRTWFVLLPAVAGSRFRIGTLSHRFGCGCRSMRGIEKRSRNVCVVRVRLGLNGFKLLQSHCRASSGLRGRHKCNSERIF